MNILKSGKRWVFDIVSCFFIENWTLVSWIIFIPLTINLDN